VFLETPRAIELLNEQLKIFNQKTDPYITFIGDKSRESLVVFDFEVDFTPWQELNWVCVNDEEIGEGNITFQTDADEFDIMVGDYHYKVTEFQSDALLVGQDVGVTAGAISITPKAGSVWFQFKDNTENGRKLCKLPPLGIGEMSVGRTFVSRAADPCPFNPTPVFEDDFATDPITTNWAIDQTAPDTIVQDNLTDVQFRAKENNFCSITAKNASFPTTLGKAYKVIFDISAVNDAGKSADLTVTLGIVERKYNIPNDVTGPIQITIYLQPAATGDEMEIKFEKVGGASDANYIEVSLQNLTVYESV
jgi:hypothetical protein